MRTRLFFILVFTTQFVFSQNILVGQKDGPGIIYVDIEDIYLYGSSTLGYDEAYLDFDLDGIDDLYLYTNGGYSSHVNYFWSIANGKPKGEAQIAIYIQDTGLIDKPGLNTSIGENLLWTGSANMKIFRSYNSDDGSTGLFNGEGYLAFRIITQDTIYGWMRVQAGCILDEAELYVFDYAYYRRIVGLHDDDPDKIVYYYNSLENNIYLNISNNLSSESYSFDIYNLSGKQVLKGMLKNGVSRIDLDGIKDHFLVLRILIEDGQYYSFKIIR